jgi:hypothetical protein
MTTAIAVSTLVLSLVAWIGQLIAAVAPRLAVRLTLSESSADVDPTFHSDGQAECVWDALTLWTLVAASVLLLVAEPSWALFGLFGGGMYVYFAGRGVAQRIVLRRAGIRVGKPATVVQAYVFLVLWGVIGGVNVVWASHDLLVGG